MRISRTLHADMSDFDANSISSQEEYDPANDNSDDNDDDEDTELSVSMFVDDDLKSEGGDNEEDANFAYMEAQTLQAELVRIEKNIAKINGIKKWKYIHDVASMLDNAAECRNTDLCKHCIQVCVSLLDRK